MTSLSGTYLFISRIFYTATTISGYDFFHTLKPSKYCLDAPKTSSGKGDYFKFTSRTSIHHHYNTTLPGFYNDYGTIHTMRMRAFFIIVLIACAYFVTTPKLLLFFDAPEYASIVTSNSFLQSLTEGHPPIKPVFMGILWILISAIRLTVQVSYPYAANLAAFGMGIIAIALFYHVCSLASLSQRNRFIAVFIYALFPAVWITSTNLMVESVLLPAYLFSEVCVM